MRADFNVNAGCQKKQDGKNKVSDTDREKQELFIHGSMIAEKQEAETEGGY